MNQSNNVKATNGVCPHTGTEYLTEREKEVLQRVMRGATNAEVARALRITEGTVKGHMNNILGKLGATNRTQAVLTAIRHGIVRPD